MTRLLFQEDSYLRETDATVEEVTPEGLVLDKTIFYPLGGGQDSDTGSIVHKGKAYRIPMVKRSSGKILHMTEDAIDGISKGDTVTLKIDWEKRYAMMRFHTSLHLLSHVAFSEFGAGIRGNSISPNKARIDLDLEGLSEDITKKIESKTNELISMGTPVEVRSLLRAEAEKMVDPGKTRLDMIPETIKEIRLVVIGDIDTDACGGTHVRNTKEIGGIEIFKTVNKGKSRKRLELKLKD